MKLIFLGPPGAGKGTQARVLSERFGARHIATGDLLRHHREEQTELGIAAQGYMERGELVPDELIIRMIESELDGAPGFILDGFPRTLAQAEAFDHFLDSHKIAIEAAVLFRADREALLKRLSARWTNPRTGRTYNTLTDPPKVAGIDDLDGGPLIQRGDDKPETVGKRLAVYEAQTKPLVEYYRGQGKLVEVNGLLDMNEVTREIVDAVVGEEGLQPS